jgi:hypothetical protein
MPKLAAAVVILGVIAFLIVLYAPALAQFERLARRFVERQIDTARRYHNNKND